MLKFGVFLAVSAIVVFHTSYVLAASSDIGFIADAGNAALRRIVSSSASGKVGFVGDLVGAILAEIRDGEKVAVFNSASAQIYLKCASADDTIGPGFITLEKGQVRGFQLAIF